VTTRRPAESSQVGTGPDPEWPMWSAESPPRAGAESRIPTANPSSIGNIRAPTEHPTGRVGSHHHQLDRLHRQCPGWDDTAAPNSQAPHCHLLPSCLLVGSGGLGLPDSTVLVRLNGDPDRRAVCGAGEQEPADDRMVSGPGISGRQHPGARTCGRWVGRGPVVVPSLPSAVAHGRLRQSGEDSTDSVAGEPEWKNARTMPTPSFKLTR
jgi:hypothetical protein